MYRLKVPKLSIYPHTHTRACVCVTTLYPNPWLKLDKSNYTLQNPQCLHKTIHHFVSGLWGITEQQVRSTLAHHWLVMGLGNGTPGACLLPSYWSGAALGLLPRVLATDLGWLLAYAACWSLSLGWSFVKRGVTSDVHIFRCYLTRSLQ